MAFDFPASPTEGQVYGRYAYSAGAWRTSLGTIADAPSDGKAYGRRNLTWQAVTEEAPNNTNIYGRRALAWALGLASDQNLADIPNKPVGRANLQAPCVPITNNLNPGGYQGFITASGNGWYAPAGGSWFIAWQMFNATSGILYSGVNIGVYAGGSLVTNGVGNVQVTGWNWRIA